MRMRMIVALAVAAVGMGTEAWAQTCRGTAAIGSNGTAMQAGVTNAFNSWVYQLGVGVLGGNDRYVGGVGVGVASYEELDATSANVSGIFMVQVAPEDTRRMVICPMAQLGYESGPNDVLGSGTDIASFG